jgi:hypothetical protein
LKAQLDYIYKNGKKNTEYLINEIESIKYEYKISDINKAKSCKVISGEELESTENYNKINRLSKTIDQMTRLISLFEFFDLTKANLKLKFKLSERKIKKEKEASDRFTKEKSKENRNLIRSSNYEKEKIETYIEEKIQELLNKEIIKMKQMFDDELIKFKKILSDDYDKKIEEFYKNMFKNSQIKENNEFQKVDELQNKRNIESNQINQSDRVIINYLYFQITTNADINNPYGNYDNSYNNSLKHNNQFNKEFIETNKNCHSFDNLKKTINKSVFFDF